ncbi:glycosyltransferase family 4 protein [Halalkalibacterium halodurans]|uniref:Uncharacterized protein n=1 Tax=Halalkalibacterium halodurans TaxID=86665 RepID=A0A0M0KGE8_ALKHA|nr:glycosyltransferase family 4 protein [Halalkalibacterium halodurans]TPE68978.1 glycosyltransferase family 4 protein [Halalkalibacterium halodurans]
MYALVVGRSFPEQRTGMMGIFEFEQAQALNNNGFNTIYLFCDTRSVKRLRHVGYSRTKSNEVPVYGYHLPIGGAPRRIFDKIKKWHYKKALTSIINDFGVPDIIHVHFPLLTLNQEIWSELKKLKRPIVVTEHWTKVQIKDIAPHYLKLLKRIVSEADSFICVGDLLRNSVMELTNTNREIKVIPNMVAPQFYYEEQHLKKDFFEFVAIGRLVEVKRFDLVIDAFTKAFANNPKVRLTIVGGGPFYDQLKKQIDDSGMNDKISMLGFLSREETADVLRKSDAFVSGSVLETFGVPFIEAMACGKPVIGIENGPIDRYINETNGLLFQSGKINNLAESMIKLYENRELYDGKKISEDAKQLFSEEAVAKQLNKIFYDCIAPQ